ncbi:MAG: hypothetical protein WBC18_22160, partial [Ottowia sp.]|uniref:hypothetical protein n=1 Tax=Ottowia sp. TaxID=1898956 RepID=UPI003C74F30A
EGVQLKANGIPVHQGRPDANDFARAVIERQALAGGGDAGDGQSGPRSGEGGFDLTIQAAAGVIR